MLQTVTHTASTSSDATNAEIPNISGDSSSFEKQITIASGNKVLVHMAIVSMTKSGAIDVGGSFGIYATQGGSTSSFMTKQGHWVLICI